MSEMEKAARRMTEKAQALRLKQDFLKTISTEQINYPIQAAAAVQITMEEIERANKTAYHGDIDGDFNWW